IHTKVDGKKIIVTKSSVRRDLQLADEEDGVVHKELGDILERAATTGSSLEVEQDSGNIDKTQSKETPNESSSQGTDSGGGPRCQETMGDTTAQTRFESVSKQSNDSLLTRGNTLQSDEDRIKLNELMALCTNLLTRVLELKKTKTTKSNEIASLKRKVKKLEKKNRSRTHKLKRLYKVGLRARVESSDDECLALEALKPSKPKVRGILVQEQEELDKSTTTTTTTTIPKQQSQDKGKATIIEEPMKTKKKHQIRLDEEVAKRLQAEFDVEERLARERAQKKEANVALIETWDDVQAKTDDDYQLAERLQANEQEELSDVEKATLFMQLLEKRRKFFAVKRVEEKRNKPPTQAQQRKTMCT
nr:hypothetical protein [Tanacetum cinerariifolium]